MHWDIPISGAVKAYARNLSYKLDLLGSELEVKYVGPVQGGTVSGTLAMVQIAMDQLGEGKFTGKKQQQSSG